MRKNNLSSPQQTTESSLYMYQQLVRITLQEVFSYGNLIWNLTHLKLVPPGYLETESQHERKSNLGEERCTQRLQVRPLKNVIKQCW